jgi:hypothetical protein
MKKTVFSLSILLLGALVQSQAQTILSENFESGAMPAGWTQTTLATDGGWKLGVNAAIQSGGFQIEPHSKMMGTNDDVCNCNKSADRIISPVMDLSTFTNVYLSYDVYFFAGTSAGKTETLKLEVSVNGGANWTTVKTFTNQGGWKSLYEDLSAYAGQSSVMISFLYGDAGGHLFGAAFDNVMVYAPIPFDVATTSIITESYIVADSVVIMGDMFNNGSDTITSLNINYSIDGNTAVTDSNVTVNILPLGTYSYSHSVKWATTDSLHWIKAWASNLNGNPDTNAINDTATVWVSVLDSAHARMVLFEEFASSTSTASASANPGFNSFLNANASKAVAIKYQMSYPVAGDPCFLDECVTRHNYYRVPGLPHVQMDGTALAGAPAAMTVSVLNAEAARPPVYDITIKWSIINGAKVFVNVIAKPLGEILPGSDLKLHIVAVENSVAHAAQSNGETTFYDVDRKMITGENGLDIRMDTITNYSANWAILDVPAAPVDPTDLNIIAFVQDNTTGQVLQAAIELAPTPNAVREIKTGEQLLSVYPNPFKGTTNISVTLSESKQVSLEVYNLVGERVFSVNKGELNAGLHTVQLDGSSLSSGMYFVNVRVGEKMLTQKIILNK